MNDYMTALHQRFYREPDFSELEEKTSQASFTAGFKLAWGIARELEGDGLYSFQQEEEQRACETVEQEVNRDG